MTRFSKLAAALAKQPGVQDPKGLAAVIGRRKYGKTEFQAMANAGRRRG